MRRSARALTALSTLALAAAWSADGLADPAAQARAIAASATADDIGQSLPQTAQRHRSARAAWSQRGNATYYHDDLQGRRTSSGERYDRNAMTAAHRTLPMGTLVRVTNLFNLRSVLVRVNDRGPFARGRSIDLSRAAAVTLGYAGRGTAPVAIEVVDRPGGVPAEARPTGVADDPAY